MKGMDYTGFALYLCFGLVLSASGHSIEDITYWLLFAVFIATDIRSNSIGYRNGLRDGGETVKQIWGIK